MKPLDIAEFQQSFLAELRRRQCGESGVSYADARGGSEALYGLTGAANIRAALGLPWDGRHLQAEMAARILAWRDARGFFEGGAGPGHGLHMVIGALNLLGEPVPAEIAPLAPTQPSDLAAWLERHDWTTTHKELCGPAIPLLASRRVGRDWVNILYQGISKRLNPEQPNDTWCRADDPAWRVISCLYHVLSIFDAGRLPYPEPGWMLRRLRDLHWEEAATSETRTFCTDGDWAWLLLRLGEQLPQSAERSLQAIRRVSERRIQAWRENPERILCASTHHLYCYLWVTAVFQSCVRDHYVNGWVRDTFNDPVLFRLK